MRLLVAEMGANTELQVGRRFYTVPRHYLALHGMKPGELLWRHFPMRRQTPDN
jgi:hypothetical protein